MLRPLILLLSLLSPRPPLDLGTSEEALNGDPTTGNELEFVVDISANGRDCTGTLISETLVLTAAHCVSGTLSLDDVSVGVTRGRASTAWRAVEVVMHPQFCGTPNCAGEVYDFGYVRLANGPRLSEYPRLFHSRAEAANTLRVGAPLVVAGFGLTSDDAIYSGNTRRLAAVDIRAVTSNRTAFSTDGSDYDTCFGDSGGPALAVGPDSEWVLTGVLSAGFGEECGHGGVYGSTVNLDQWLFEAGYTRDPKLEDPSPEQSTQCSFTQVPSRFDACALVPYLAAFVLFGRRATVRRMSRSLGRGHLSVSGCAGVTHCPHTSGTASSSIAGGNG